MAHVLRTVTMVLGRYLVFGYLDPQREGPNTSLFYEPGAKGHNMCMVFEP